MNTLSGIILYVMKPGEMFHIKDEYQNDYTIELVRRYNEWPTREYAIVSEQDGTEFYILRIR